MIFDDQNVLRECNRELRVHSQVASTPTHSNRAHNKHPTHEQLPNSIIHCNHHISDENENYRYQVSGDQAYFETRDEPDLD
mmetsp:Transcript_54794/g.66040  ORF Transcript_54794/g.66040 Transcript_54794/m.66040 type:complete len:81 (+) Transcript_54794:579-821(+)